MVYTVLIMHAYRCHLAKKVECKSRSIAVGEKAACLDGRHRSLNSLATSAALASLALDGFRFELAHHFDLRIGLRLRFASLAPSRLRLEIVVVILSLLLFTTFLRNLLSRRREHGYSVGIAVVAELVSILHSRRLACLFQILHHESAADLWEQDASNELIRRHGRDLLELGLAEEDVAISVALIDKVPHESLEDAFPS